MNLATKSSLYIINWEAWELDLMNWSSQSHCTENLIYVFPEMKLRGLIPNSYIHVSVSDLHIPKISLPNKQTNPGNI